MSMDVFEKPKVIDANVKKRDIPEGLWVKCKECGEMIFAKELLANLKVCPKCDYHFSMLAAERVASLADEGTWTETDADLMSVDVLKFTGVAAYSERLKTYQRQTGMADAIQIGLCKINGHDIALAVMDFSFLGGSMGSVVGERFVRGVHACLEQDMPLVCIAASGGARMQEGLFSLLQMAKTTAALTRLAARKLPFISVLTDPTMGGVSASFAMIGDVVIAEPRALIGFAGPRVIEQTVREKLPEGFQRAEFLLDKGAIDMIVDRRQLRDRLVSLLTLLMKQPAVA